MIFTIPQRPISTRVSMARMTSRALLAITALATLLLGATMAPANAWSDGPYEVRELAHECQPNGTTVWPVKLINRSDEPQTFEVLTETVVNHRQRFHTREVRVAAESRKLIRFRSSEKRYVAWVISTDETAALGFRIFSDACD